MKWAERALWAFVLGLFVVRFGPQAGAAAGFGRELGSMPQFRIETLDGDLISSEDVEGKVVLVNFWATWCGPCRLEMPGFQGVYEDYKDEGFVILGLSTDRGDLSTVTEFLEARGVEYPVAMSTRELEIAFAGIRGLPMSFLIDRDGIIQNRVYGFFAPPALRLAVRGML
jgi:thiol-disulfide isomerase/thioredoxin